MAYATITRGTSRHNYTVVADDGSSFLIPTSIGKSLSLSTGQQLTQQQFEQLKEKVALIVTREKALELLSRREHGEYELYSKLLQKGFDKEIIQQVLTQLKKENLLSDYRYASSLIRSRQKSNPEGVGMLRLRLRSKRVNPEAIERAIEEWSSDDDNYNLAIKRAVEKYLRKNRDREKLLLALMKKGFSRRELLEVLQEIDE